MKRPKFTVEEEKEETGEGKESEEKDSEKMELSSEEQVGEVVSKLSDQENSDFQKTKSVFKKSFQDSPIALPRDTGQIKKIILIVLIVAGALALIGGGILVYQKGMNQVKNQISEPTSETPTSTPTPAEEVEASPTPEINRSDLSIQILNGSGEPGLAGKAKKLLEDLGYEGVETGNASSYDYDETEISIKASKEDYLEMLTDDLSEEYTLAAETETLDEDSEFDVIITLGK